MQHERVTQTVNSQSFSFIFPHLTVFQNVVGILGNCTFKAFSKVVYTGSLQHHCILIFLLYNIYL